MAKGMSRITRQEFRRASLKLQKLAGNLDKATSDVVRQIGEDIMFDIKASRPGKGVPVDQGTLRGTGRVDMVVQKAAELSFGGASAPYALVQHENTDYAHRVGESRYLVRGVERWQPGGVSAQLAYAELQREIDKLAISRKGKKGLAKHTL